MTETILRALIVIRRRQLEIQLGLARTTIYDKMNPRSPRYDASFPTPIRLGKGAAVGWLAHEVDDWLNQQIKNSRAGSS